jgi:hypothetical protein
MTYEVIRTEITEASESPYEITCVVRLRRSDGVEGDVWVHAGIAPDRRGSARASGNPLSWATDYWPLGDSLDCWVDQEFLADDLSAEDVDAILEAAGKAAVREIR